VVADDRCRQRHPQSNAGATMIFFAQQSSWWNALVHRTRINNDIEAELQFHIDAHIQHLIETGVAPQEAAR
jgi:hypothetical protein